MHNYTTKDGYSFQATLSPEEGLALISGDENGYLTHEWDSSYGIRINNVWHTLEFPTAIELQLYCYVLQRISEMEIFHFLQAIDGYAYAEQPTHQCRRCGELWRSSTITRYPSKSCHRGKQVCSWKLIEPKFEPQPFQELG